MDIHLKYSEPQWRYNNELITLREEETDPSYGEYPKNRPVERLLKYGFIALDKHVGPTSHDVTAHVKRILGISEVGHGGTLELSGRSRRVRCLANPSGESD
jgi:H/ACA ribonucleoprotein complex subunit 4